MKSRIILLFLPAILLSTTINGQTIEKTLVKSFNLKGNDLVLVDVDANISINEWNEDQMRVIMKVSLDNGSEMMLKSLVKVGRYNLESADDIGGLKIFAPGLERQVKLKSGNELKEQIEFEIFAPANVVIKLLNSEAIAEKTDSTF